VSLIILKWNRSSHAIDSTCISSLPSSEILQWIDNHPDADGTPAGADYDGASAVLPSGGSAESATQNREVQSDTHVHLNRTAELVFSTLSLTTIHSTYGRPSVLRRDLSIFFVACLPSPFDQGNKEDGLIRYTRLSIWFDFQCTKTRPKLGVTTSTCRATSCSRLYHCRRRRFSGSSVGPEQDLPVVLRYEATTNATARRTKQIGELIGTRPTSLEHEGQYTLRAASVDSFSMR
jgi:hypothetical protein